MSWFQGTARARTSMWGTLLLAVMCPNRDVSIFLPAYYPEPSPSPTTPQTPFLLEDFCLPGLCPQGCHTCISRAIDLAATTDPKGNSCSSLEDSSFSLFFQASQLLLTAPLSIFSSHHTHHILLRAQGFRHMVICILTRQLPPMRQWNSESFDHCLNGEKRKGKREKSMY